MRMANPLDRSIGRCCICILTVRIALLVIACQRAQPVHGAQIDEPVDHISQSPSGAVQRGESIDAGVTSESPTNIDRNVVSDETPLEQRSTRELIDAALAGWEELASANERMQATVEVETTIHSDGESTTPPHSLRLIKITKDGEQIKAELVRESGAQGVLAMNTDYVFRLGGNKESDDDVRLEFVEPLNQAQEDVGELIAEYRWITIRDVFASCHFMGRPAFDWFRDPLMNVDRVEFAQTDAGRRATIHFTYSTPTEENKDYLRPSTLVCDPDHHWRILSLTAGRFWGTVQIDVTYPEEMTHEFLPERIIEQLIGEDGTAERIATVMAFSRHETRPEEFRVTAYGIPEPSFESGRFWTVVFLLLNGCLLAGLAYYLSHRQKKNS